MKLKPCPFCGNEKVYASTTLYNSAVFCSECRATIERGFPYGKCDSLSEAIELFETEVVEAWNRRAIRND